MAPSPIQQAIDSDAADTPRFHTTTVRHQNDDGETTQFANDGRDGAEAIARPLTEGGIVHLERWAPGHRIRASVMAPDDDGDPIRVHIRTRETDGEMAEAQELGYDGGAEATGETGGNALHQLCDQDADGPDIRKLAAALLLAGTDRRARDAEGRTPGDLARGHGQNTLADAIEHDHPIMALLIGAAARRAELLEAEVVPGHEPETVTLHGLAYGPEAAVRAALQAVQTLGDQLTELIVDARGNQARQGM